MDGASCSSRWAVLFLTVNASIFSEVTPWLYPTLTHAKTHSKVLFVSKNFIINIIAQILLMP